MESQIIKLDIIISRSQLFMSENVAFLEGRLFPANESYLKYFRTAVIGCKNTVSLTSHFAP